MITQNSNNKPTGFTGKTCDAGTPVSGKTSGDVYTILQTNPAGALISAVGLITSAPFVLTNPQTIIQTGGALATGTFIGAISVGSIAEGMYRVNPAFFYETAVAGGGITFVLYSTTGAMGAYIAGLANNTPFAPATGQVQGGLAGIWHNTASQQLGAGSIYFAYNRNNALDIYLSATTYGLAIVTDGAVNINGGSSSTAGFTEFSKIG